jgi:hypothetical protein
MRGAHRTAVLTRPRTCAVTWIDERHAVVARNSEDGSVTVTEVGHPGPSGSDATYLARVVDEIGDQERLVILGPGAARLALEREYVTIFHRPDRLLDVEPSGPLDRAALVERLQTLIGP